MFKKLFIALTALVLVSSIACSKLGGGSAVSFDGTYTFDAAAYKTQMASVPGATPEALDKMTQAFTGFKIDIKGTEATVTFGDMIVAGTLEKTSEDADGTKFKMTPKDEDKKNSPITIQIKDGVAKAGPDGRPEQWMTFKK